ncbi:AraC family transcriptional regulator [Streptosporangium sp. NPDC048865]|uniref:AraC family transcriptional regulator n=1 Tax=Streptosporangium sp. NPDC048865 TaxID=3155766 RepID=UPI0034473A8D
MEYLIERAVTAIHERYSEPLHLEDLAKMAMLSKFHFLRMFRRATGVTPGRFLSAVRLQEAKRLLLTTSFNVAYISAQVGYSGTGTFTRRFSESVGLSPTQYRRMTQGDEDIRVGTAAPHALTKACGSMTGTIEVLGAPLSSIYIGVFNSPILQGHPYACAMRDQPGPFRLTSIPPGTWYLHAVAHGAHSPMTPYCDQPLLVDTAGPITVRPNREVELHVAIRPLDWTRPPILLALPGLDPLPSVA